MVFRGGVGEGSICFIVFDPSVSSVLSTTKMSIHILKIPVYRLPTEMPVCRCLYVSDCSPLYINEKMLIFAK